MIIIKKSLFALHNGTLCNRETMVWPDFLGIDFDNKKLVHFDEEYKETEYNLVYYDMKECFAVGSTNEPDNLVHFRWYKELDLTIYRGFKIDRRVALDYIFEMDKRLYIIKKKGIFLCTITDIVNNLNESRYKIDQERPEIVLENRRYSISHYGGMTFIKREPKESKKKKDNNKSKYYERDDRSSDNQIPERHTDNEEEGL